MSTPSNYVVNATVRPVTRLAWQAARRGARGLPRALGRQEQGNEVHHRVMTIRRYSVAYSQWVVGGLAVIALMFGFGVWECYRWLGNEERTWTQGAFWVLWFVVLLFMLFRTLTAAREIIVHEGDEIEFVSRLERQRLMARDIRSIRVTSGEYAQILVRHASGKIYLAGAMNDFHQFVTDLKQANPGIELVGC